MSQETRSLMLERKVFFAAIFTLLSVVLVPSAHAAVVPPIGNHTVGGTITGLMGSKLMLQS